MMIFSNKTLRFFTLLSLAACLIFSFSKTAYANEIKATWISYLNWEELPTEQTAFEQAVDQMMENCRKLGLNTVFVHAHSHSDSYYPSSEVFPSSKFSNSVQGEENNYDAFGYMVKSAHAHDLKIHAWFNPYRVTGYLMSWEEVSNTNPAKIWWNSTNQHRNVILHQGEYYLNPSKPEVMDKIVAAVAEVVERYEIDGVQFDDYFYPTLDDSSPSAWFDKPEYDSSRSKTSITQWRRDNVSTLVLNVNRKIKSIRPSLAFGISPQGSLENLRSDKQLFVDIERWLNGKFIDYVIPQLYWGFETKHSDGSPASYAFENNLKQWIELNSKSSVQMYLGLGLYKGGSSIADGNEISEWQRYDDIIAREVTMARESGKVDGFSFYAYKSFFDEASKKETENLLKVLSKTNAADN